MGTGWERSQVRTPGALYTCTHHVHTTHITHANIRKHTRTWLPVLPQTRGRTWVLQSYALLLIQVGHKQYGADSCTLTGPSQPYSAWSTTLLSFRKVNAVYLVYPCEASARQQADKMRKSNKK